MSLRRKLFVMIFIPLLTGVFFCSLGIWQGSQTRDVLTKGELFDDVEHCAHVLTILTQEIFLHPDEKRPQMQWQRKSGELATLLQKIDPKTPTTLFKVSHIGETHAKLNQLFSEIIHLSELLHEQTPPDPLLIEERNRLIGSISLANHKIVSDANSLSTEVRREREKQQALIIWTIATVTFLFMVIMTLMAFWIGKSILVPLNTLQKGVRAVSSGNLTYSIGLESQDEFGQFSRTFDDMLGHLRKTMTSRDKLEDALKKRSEALNKSRMAAISVMQDAEIQQKRAEEALAEVKKLNHQIEYILGATKTGMSIIDADMTVRYVNPEWQKIYGDPAGENYSDYFMGGAELPADYPALKAFESRKSVVYEKRLPKENNRPVLATAVPYQDENKEWLVAEINVDIAERKRMEDELKQAKDTAIAANRAKSVFLANMSHELRTPLNAVLGFTGIMDNTPWRSEGDRKYLEIINRSGKHLLQLINDVLDMSKIEAGRILLDEDDFDLGDLVRDVIDMMQVRSREKGLQLILDQTSRFPRFIHGDAAKLRQILINLLSNAVKFTEVGGVTLRLDALNNHPDIITLRGEVEDTGSGIAAEAIERIFIPFEQLVDSKTQKGTGLGLSITRQFVEMMNGEIVVESTPGSGSLFRFNLQVEHAQGEVAAKDTIETQCVIALSPGQPEYRVLIVEDQLDNQLLLRTVLESIGFAARIAENGEKAIAIFQEWQPHFIFMDRRMPVMDGLTATRKIRELPGGKKVKIVAITASVFKDQRNEIMESGTDDFVNKPYKPEDIYNCLARHLGVRYEYEEQDKVLDDEGTMQEEVSPEALAALPEKIRAELRSHVVALDVEQAMAVIGQIGERDPGLAGPLRSLVEGFNFKRIQQLLQETEE